MGPKNCHVIKYTAPAAPVTVDKHVIRIHSDRKIIYSMYDNQSEFAGQQDVGSSHQSLSGLYSLSVVLDGDMGTKVQTAFNAGRDALYPLSPLLFSFALPFYAAAW
jgi:hypothetical protein